MCSNTPIANFSLQDLVRSFAKFKRSEILPGACMIMALGPRDSTTLVYITEAPLFK